MTVSALVATLLATPLPPLPAVQTPTPLPVIVWVKADGPKEIVRIALLGFDADHAPHAPDTLDAKLSIRGRATAVKLRRHWQGDGAVPGGWVGADYVLDIPAGATGDAVLSLEGARDGWSFHLGKM